MFRIQLLDLSLIFGTRRLDFPDHADHSYALNDVPYIWVAETGPWPRDVIYFVKCMNQWDHPFPFRRSNDKELVRVPLCHARPEVPSRRNFQQLGKWVHIYYDDQEPGNALFNSFSLQYIPFPAHLLAFTA